MRKNVWLVRPLPHGTNHMVDFLNSDIIAVGYPVGKNLINHNYSDIRTLLEQFDWEEGVGNVNSFVNVMKRGDIVVVPDDNKKDVYFGEIKSEYVYEESLDIDKKGTGYPHQRRVKWFFDKEPLIRTELPEELKVSMRYPGAIADITKHYNVVNSIIYGEKELELNSSLEDKAMSVLEKLLNSNEEEIRYKAAKTILEKR
ncbi:hypothetical protein [Alkalihalobacillus trypoxylicola]|uniref:Uncharacterized protein n=1 Tax=Alkalihalobacillus trypoxylicola TaxID=519424 RepID=A0A162F6W8_9BACI|nr:hypothetical protein [Alkalihalobacillus trypoxylicola]KYG34929.1 hypothetical protein AZF04_00940 [Alkalihalobacillus trypoxylicola]